MTSPTALAITPPGGAEWIIILLILVLLFGAKKLPELGSSVGRSIRNFKQGVEEAENDGDAGRDGEVSQDPGQLSRDQQ